MKSIFFVFLAAFLIGFSTAHGQADPNTMLWEISGKDLSRPSYLFGTFHLMCPEDLHLTDAIKNALKTSEQLVLELDFDDPNLPAEMQREMVFTDGKTTRDYLSEAELAIVSAFFRDSLGMPFDQVAAVKPFLLSTFLYPKYMGCQPASWEQTLVQLAAQQQTEVLGIETVSQQLAILDKMPYEQQADVLLQGITEFDGMKTMLGEMVNLYKAQRLADIQSFSNQYLAEFESLEKAILEDRNRAWIPAIERLIHEKPTFFGVGAAHLGGSTGVIDLLRAEGYTVTPVPNRDAPAAPAANPLAQRLSRKWKLDESVIPQAVEDVLNSVRQQNPEQAKALEGQKEALAQGLRGTVIEYKTDGTYSIVTFGQLMPGTWTLSADGKQILKTDSNGEQSTNEILELSEGKLVVLNDKKQRMVYVAR